MTTTQPIRHPAAPHPVYCEKGRIHHPRTVEGRDEQGTHVKTKLCRLCNKVSG